MGEELFNIMQNEGLSTLQVIHPHRERGLLPSREAAELSPEADADNTLTKTSRTSRPHRAPASVSPQSTRGISSMDEAKPCNSGVLLPYS